MIEFKNDVDYEHKIVMGERKGDSQVTIYFVKKENDKIQKLIATNLVTSFEKRMKDVR